ncbi:hypothetical protein GXP71_09095 [Cellulomonas sp. H30R-01]|uniref:hypothetical protein n=1 Tax=Cellulomonas sp. H30R-01 TaxID=2704467 RepID=UPI00138DB34D|nr:hypothetical protein [Cellulomonas sp. H30R-01]QHT56219.1 hypothetical protein GXP71_09095 [Cellulomonas sp. H30R-01]
MHTKESRRRGHRFGRVLPTVAVTAAALLVGAAGAEASTPQNVPTATVAGARTASPVGATGTTSAVRTASTWEFAGYYPDPLLCHLSGIASGRPYTCNFIFVGWTLWLRTS